MTAKIIGYEGSRRSDTVCNWGAAAIVEGDMLYNAMLPHMGSKRRPDDTRSVQLFQRPFDIGGYDWRKAAAQKWGINEPGGLFVLDIPAELAKSEPYAETRRDYIIVCRGYDDDRYISVWPALYPLQNFLLHLHCDYVMVKP